MASYRIEWKPTAVKELRKLPRQMIPRIVSAVDHLAASPFPDGSKKLVGSDHTFRVRVGDYRVIYDVLETVMTILIIRVAHRDHAYRRR
jgi:mRNA interferase RelE/StbE